MEAYLTRSKNMSWNQPSWNQSSTREPAFMPADVRDERVGAFLSKVYGWMFLGLLITAGTAFAVASSPAIIEIVFLNRLVFWALLIAQLGLVFYLAARVDKVAPVTAAGLFILYSALMGVTSSVILLLYTGASITSTFIITAGMFGATAFFGTVTKRNLAGIGQFFFMGLIGLILASIVGFFWQSEALQFVISVVGVLVFTGLTAWDAQRLKQMAVALPDGRVGAYAVVGALSLYLDFINLFFFLLRLTGNRRN
jgi:FtsH-binding integral membrane protein